MIEEFTDSYKIIQTKQEELKKLIKKAKEENIEKIGELSTEISNTLVVLEKNCS